MQFKLSAFAAVLSVVSHAQAQLSDVEIVGNINAVTDLSADTQLIAAGITYQNVPDRGPKTIDNFRGIADLVTKDISGMSGQNVPPAVEGQTKICEAFRNFVIVHQQLLDTVISKRGFLSQSEYTVPIAQVLLAIEGGVDTHAFETIDLVPTCSGGFNEDKLSLDAKLKLAIEVYD
ncbi:hypothetical protein F5X99DRAFT_410782 [Biscogniauxia marginata]|nr:hypothetical protein F5X99DRAFT_410782 [Biscogniauxia marginata]